jgi:hypothetical protein
MNGTNRAQYRHGIEIRLSWSHMYQATLNLAHGRLGRDDATEPIS